MEIDLGAAKGVTAREKLENEKRVTLRLAKRHNERILFTTYIFNSGGGVIDSARDD